MRFYEFVDRFTPLDKSLKAVAETSNALELDAQEIPGYVPPVMSISAWPEGASVVLVEAPGAVGKSAAASAIAAKLRWPVVRSERAQVGSYSLSGIIQDALGFSSTFLGEVAAGRAGIVIDSLDEAHFKAGTENFLAFLDNVIRVAGTRDDAPRAHASIVLMSRSDTANLVRLAFEEHQLPLASVRLDFFEKSGSEAFINAYLQQRFRETGKTEYNVPLASPRPFERLRDDRFRQIAKVLTAQSELDLRADWPQVADFLGYAPVLVAMAESMAVKNPSSKNAQLAASDQTDLLREIIGSIAARERGKFRDQLTNKLVSHLPAASESDLSELDFYSESEQCARLIAYVHGSDLVTQLPAAMPSEVRAVYEDAARTFIPDHPFLRGREFASVVFRDYVMARACRDFAIRAALGFAPEASIETVGPFFARFLAGSDQSGETAIIPERLIEHVISSWNQESDLVAASDSDVSVTLLEDVQSVVCRRSAKLGSPTSAELEFEISDASGAWHITRPLRRASVITDQALILGERASSLTLGPRALLAAGEISIESETLRIDTDRGRSVGAFIASDIVSANQLAKVETGTGDLWFFCPDPPPRLRPFTREFTTGGTPVPFAWFMDLRTLLLSFRPSMGGDGNVAVHAAKLDKKIVKGSRRRLRILAYLEESGVVSRQGQLCFLDLPALGEHGFGVQDLRAGEPSEAVLRFLRECIRSIGSAKD